ncbi:MAG: response regulator transcription factor [Thermodesulfobacteriota bacterium]
MHHGGAMTGVHEKQGRPAAPGPGKVLIVEDDEYIAELLRYWFQRDGFTTCIASDGLAACSMVEGERPDTILLDLMLPGLDGREICRLIRRHRDPRIAATPIIMLSALSAPEDIARGLDLGADLYLAKPYSVREVLAAARALMQPPAV